MPFSIVILIEIASKCERKPKKFLIDDSKINSFYIRIKS